MLVMSAILSAEEPVILENADSSRIRILEDSIMTYLYGNVRFRQGQSLIQADSVFFSSNGYYRFMGNTMFRDTIRDIYTESMTYNSEEDVFLGIGAVRMIDESENMALDGDTVRYDNKTNVLTVYGNPFVVFNRDDPTAMIEVSADTLIYYSEQKFAEVFGDVVIIKSTLRANCGKAVLMPDSNLLVLIRDPRAYQLDNTVKGDSMTIYLQDELLDRIDITGRAEAVYRQQNTPGDSAFTESTLEAKNIQFQFEDEELDRIVSAGNSYSEFIPVANDTIAAGRNIASGDSIKLHFQFRRLTEVEIITSVLGKYFSNPKLDTAGMQVMADTINYQSDYLKYRIGQSVINLRGNGRVTHQNVELESHDIRYNTARKVVRADAVWRVDQAGDSTYFPVVLRDQADEIFGERLAYNVETRKGKIKESDTKLEQAYYHGNVLRKESDDVLYVKGGQYIPCEFRDANFYFYSNKMKLIPDDRIIAKPIVLYIERIPVFYLPYFVFSIKKDRHSGFTPFQIGNFERGSRFINNLGYYWALSDYFDLETTLDYNDEVGFTFNAGVRYALRYRFSGSISGSYARESDFTFQGENKRSRWRLEMSHQQTISQTASLNGRGSFVSDARYYNDNSTNLEDRLNRNLESQLNFRQSWGRVSFTSVVSGTKNLDDNSTSYSLPRLSLSIPSRQVFPAERSEEKRWFNSLVYSYSVNSLNSLSRSGPDTARTERHYANVRHSSSVSMPTTLLRYLTISPSVNLTESWFYIFDTDQSSERDLMSETGLRRFSYSAGVGANTRLYGLFRPPIKGVIGLRHVLTPSVSFSYQPESDRHQEEASYAGIGSGGSERQTMGLRLSNLFQLKYKSGEEEKKLDLFTLDFSTGYNFKSESYKWSDLSTTLNSTTIPHLQFTLRATHDLYDRDEQKLDILGAELRSLSFNTSFNYGGDFAPVGLSYEVDSMGRIIPLENPKKNPWRFSFSHNYSETRGSFGTNITHTLRMSSEFNLTQNWKVSFSQYYDVRDKKVVDRSFAFHRDMRCWEAVFHWIPNGSRKGYYFRINLKQLPDVKLEKSESGVNSPFTDPFR